MLSSRTQAVCDALLQARRDFRLADSTALSGALVDEDEAYEVQDAVAAALGWFEAMPPHHWKSGGVSRESGLTHAPLPPVGVWSSGASAAEWPFTLRGIEIEIGLRLGRPIDGALAASLDETRARSLIEAMAVTIEVVDSRWSEGLEAPALLKLADMQSHGALVLGDWSPYSPRDWMEQTCRVEIGEREAVERRGTHGLGDPTWLLPQWLRHATRGGRTLAEGTVVTTGSWVGVLPAGPGEHVVAIFDGVGSASLQL